MANQGGYTIVQLLVAMSIASILGVATSSWVDLRSPNYDADLIQGNVNDLHKALVEYYSEQSRTANLAPAGSTNCDVFSVSLSDLEGRFITSSQLSRTGLVSYRASFIQAPATASRERIIGGRVVVVFDSIPSATQYISLHESSAQNDTEVIIDRLYPQKGTLNFLGRMYRNISTGCWQDGESL
ncbi:type II secretion system GspH family protein [Vibrio tubiashii]|uniref:type II secretion system protein n=1 Tax=Vibrio tubiashii TaxID=29498 RepID=UPI001EFE852C|nr:type II secretion system protein [Vibrio tubiashii]MCG9576715.1 type II secretion system GspH family protein [Vibrio tubiashii]